MKKAIIYSFFILSGQVVSANVTPNALFSENAVFQQNITVPIWGTADSNESVTVEFAGQTLSTVALNGHWMVKLNPLKAGGPFDLVIKGKNIVTFSNILVGEVWICSGQSNMEMPLAYSSTQNIISKGAAQFWRRQKPVNNCDAEVAAANYPEIREFTLPINALPYPISELKGKWAICDTATVKQFSAVSYFFGSELFKKINVPIGLINTSVGGTPAESWTSRAALETNLELQSLVDAYDKAVFNYPDSLQKFKDNEAALLKKQVAEDKTPLLQKLIAPTDPLRYTRSCSVLFNAMINPLIPYAFKGVIWYQGEGNSSRAKQYQTLFPTMIADWRRQWNIGDFPFLFVQIAPHRGMTPEIREAQLLTWQKTPNTAMIVTIDCGDTADIHPSNKRPVGERLALAARALAYGEKNLAYSGPVYQAFKVMDNKIILSFTHIANGLVAKDSDDLWGFTISEDGKTFFPAKAEIKGNSVIVYNENMSKPKAVRYAFINNANGNLFNSEGLPASPFRTDVN